MGAKWGDGADVAIDVGTNTSTVINTNFTKTINTTITATPAKAGAQVGRLP